MYLIVLLHTMFTHLSRASIFWIQSSTYDGGCLRKYLTALTIFAEKLSTIEVLVGFLTQFRPLFYFI